MSTENLKLKSRKELMKLTKKEIFDNLENDAVIFNNVIKEKDDIINSKYKLISELEKDIDTQVRANKNFKETLDQYVTYSQKLEKDLSIMQQALNDVEEKNRALNVQLLDLRKALKTASQYLWN